MKRFKTLFAILALVASANIALAGEKAKVSIVPLSGEKAIVSVSSEEAASYKLVLKTEDGEVIHKTNTKGEANFKKVYDLSKLEDGNYSLVINNNDFKAERNFEIADNNIIVGEHHYASAPVFSFRNDILRVSYLNYDDEPVSLKVYNKDDNLVYSKDIENNFAVQEGINFEKVNGGGDFYVVLSNEEENYSYTINK